MDHDSYEDGDIRNILMSVKRVAVVGASANAARPSFGVMRFLLSKGYEVLPVNPGHAGGKIHGQTVFASLSDIEGGIDMIDVFRAPEHLQSVVAEAIALPEKPQVIWGQLGVRDDAAAALAETNGIKMIMDRCPAIEYPRLVG